MNRVARPQRWRSFLGRVPHWCRIVMDRDIAEFVRPLPRDRLDAVEISGTAHRRWGFRSYDSLQFPDFDLCRPPEHASRADVVFCEQVLEHVADPAAAAATLRTLVRPGGYVVVSVPFLLRIHREPTDHWRFTPDGLALLLSRAGLQVEKLRAWGNTPCLIANRLFWFPYVPLLCPLWNAPGVPLVVWAIARRPAEPSGAGEAI